LATSAPELLLVSGRASDIRLTARAGFALGLLLATSAFSALTLIQTRADAMQASRERGASEQAHAQALHAAQAQTQGLCRVLLYWLARDQKNTTRMRQLEAAFPDFKTDMYRLPQLALRSETERQQAENQSLHSALQSAPGAQAACGVSAQASGDVLWSGGDLVLHRQGWRLVSP